MSDLHLEFGSLYIDKAARLEPDLVILAGDIHTGSEGIVWAKKVWKNKPILYVPGNHEYYRRSFTKQNEKFYRARADNIAVLHPGAEAVHFGDYTFLGATLWTDMRLTSNLPLTKLRASTTMNDFSHIRDFTPDTWLAAHEEHLAWLSCMDERTIVVTHHAPSSLSILDRRKGDLDNAYFASSLENLILDKKPLLWVHGHMHNSSDYVIGSTRVICNPRGYFGKELNPDFNPNLIVEI